ncbi:MAG TPA: hypothetical protein VJ323_02155, partial [Bryobacteraceae bacterium]|nr:hypothetical protein [Bryobacteraceae bacterium]
PLNDRIARVYFPVKEGMVDAGQWWVEEGAARVLHNFLSRDLIREHAFGRFLLAIKNNTTAIELSWSPFHAVFEFNEAIGSEIAIGLRQIVNLGFRNGQRNQIFKGVKTILKAPAAGVTTAKLGSMAKKTFGEFTRSPEGQEWLKQHPGALQDIEDFFNGGGKIGQNEEFKAQARNSFKEYWKSASAQNPGHYLSAAMRAIPTFSQWAMKPLFEWYIPNLKLGFFLKEYALTKAEYSDRLASGEVTREQLARHVVDSIENRFGEMNFDNLFWNRTFKTALQLTFRSVTWKVGNLAANAGAITGEIGEVRRAIEAGEKPLLHQNTSWFLGMSIWTAIFGGTITTLAGLLAGKKLADARPKQLKDFVYPIIDATTGIRVSLPTYWRDLVHLMHSPLNYVTSSLMGQISRLVHIWQDKDFYGDEVFSEDDPFYERAWDKLRHLIPLPFMWSSYKQAKGMGGNLASELAGFAGFTKAPR